MCLTSRRAHSALQQIESDAILANLWRIEDPLPIERITQW